VSAAAALEGSHTPAERDSGVLTALLRIRNEMTTKNDFCS
jgi:hypothetical protein